MTQIQSARGPACAALVVLASLLFQGCCPPIKTLSGIDSSSALLEVTGANAIAEDYNPNPGVCIPKHWVLSSSSCSVNTNCNEDNREEFGVAISADGTLVTEGSEGWPGQEPAPDQWVIQVDQDDTCKAVSEEIQNGAVPPQSFLLFQLYLQYPQTDENPDIVLYRGILAWHQDDERWSELQIASAWEAVNYTYLASEADTSCY